MIDYNNMSVSWLCFGSLMLTISKANIWESSVGLHTWNTSTQDAEAKGLPLVQNYPGFIETSSLLSLYGKEKKGKKKKINSRAFEGTVLKQK